MWTEREKRANRQSSWKVKQRISEIHHTVALFLTPVLFKIVEWGPEYDMKNYADRGECWLRWMTVSDWKCYISKLTTLPSRRLSSKHFLPLFQDINRCFSCRYSWKCRWHPSSNLSYSCFYSAVLVREIRLFRLYATVKSVDTIGTRNKLVTSYIRAIYRRNDWFWPSSSMVTECAPAGYEELTGRLVRANQKRRNILNE